VSTTKEKTLMVVATTQGAGVGEANASATAPTIDFDRDALRDRYRADRDKGLRPDGIQHYRARACLGGYPVNSTQAEGARTHMFDSFGGVHVVTMVEPLIPMKRLAMPSESTLLPLFPASDASS
jgi:hypothetical protein